MRLRRFILPSRSWNVAISSVTDPELRRIRIER